jgi:transcriptional regulator with XRE-family HTH domain
MGFSQKHVARLLGLAGTSMLSRYEHGRSMPPLQVALCLGIIFRVPVEFLFPGLYDRLRNDIRAEEELLATPTQQILFSKIPLTPSSHAQHP